MGGKKGKPTLMDTSDVFALLSDGSICYLGFAGRMCWCGGENVLRVDYERYISDEDFLISLSDLRKEKELKVKKVRFSEINLLESLSVACESDLNRYLNTLKQKIMSQLEESTILELEFK